METREKVSAGGVAFRETANGVEIAVILTAGKKRWQLPKGIIDPGETPEQAALREVREEAGIDCDLVAPIDKIEYWFVDRYGDEPVRIHKSVHFFLMKYRSGDVADHDDEVAEARWTAIGDAEKDLVFETERACVRKAEKMIAELK